MTDGTYYPLNVPANLTHDWIPYEIRTTEGKYLTDEFHEQIGEWGDLGLSFGELPERVIDEEAERLVTGTLLPRPYQLTGSCVGKSWWRAFCNATIGDILYRGDVEDVAFAFPFATYGIGRQLAGMRSKGDGSYGAAQAKAGQEFGALPIDHPGLPKPTISGGWMWYTKAIEYQWSHPSGWPMPVEELRNVAKPFGIGEYKRLRSPQEVCEAKAAGCGVTMASNWGTRGCRVVDNVLMGKHDGSWAHQMSCGGYWRHPSLGLIFKDDNQWKDVHGHCPTLFPMGITGSFWLPEDSMAYMCERGEVYAHTNTGGRPLKLIDWKNLGIVYGTAA